MKNKKKVQYHGNKNEKGKNCTMKRTGDELHHGKRKNQDKTVTMKTQRKENIHGESNTLVVKKQEALVSSA